MKRTRLLAACAATLLLAPAAARAADAPSTIAVIGDTPYGAAQIADFPGDIATINADPAVSLVMHLGDIKNGSSPCTDDYFAQIRADFDTFADPFVYTPGDNEWTDCHRASNGGYVPTERLAKLRQVFFNQPGVTLGAPRQVTAQPKVPENVRFTQSGAVVATFNVPGSNDDREPWFGDRKDTNGHAIPETSYERGLQQHEVAVRRRANLQWLDATFVAARVSRAPAVILALQADMFDPTAAHLSGYNAYIQRIAQRAKRFGRPVLLLNGDSHHFEDDHPFPGAPNVERITVNGSDSCPHEYLRLTIDPSAAGVYSFERVPLPSSGPLCGTASSR